MVLEEAKLNGEIIEFCGDGCPFCLLIHPAIDRIARDEGVKFRRIEVWVNRENRVYFEAIEDLLSEFNRGRYTVPTFFDQSKPREKQLLVNPRNYEVLRAWVLGED